MTTEVKTIPVKQEREYTAQEFEALPEFDERYELIDGKLVKKPMPGQEHSLIARIITKHYDRFDPDENIGQMLQEVSVTLGIKNVPTPDLAFWKVERKPARTKGAASIPDLAIEVLSPRDIKSKRRREQIQEKVRKFQAAQVSLIWVINPASRTVEIFRPEEEAPVKVLELKDELDGEEVIPGFKLPVRLLFE